MSSTSLSQCQQQQLIGKLTCWAVLCEYRSLKRTGKSLHLDAVLLATVQVIVSSGLI